MSNLKQLRTRIKSIKSTQKITKAMQMVSVAKLKRVRQGLEASISYLDEINVIVTNTFTNELFQDLDKKDHIFFDLQNIEKSQLLVVVTSERGLCGGFNASIIKKAKSIIESFREESKPFKLVIVGKKGYEALRKYCPNEIDSYFHVTKDKFDILISKIKSKIVSLFQMGEVGSCVLLFNKFENVMQQIPTTNQILPILPSDEQSQKYEYEGKDLITTAIDLYLTGYIRCILFESNASEEAARMTAMDNATKNAGDIIDKLTLKLNRTRQANITRELIEIISGASAL